MEIQSAFLMDRVSGWWTGLRSLLVPAIAGTNGGVMRSDPCSEASSILVRIPGGVFPVEYR
jgi:hypothetical protein